MASYDQSPPDEGYSEDPLTVGNVSGSATPPAWLLPMSVRERTELAMSIINHLPTSEVWDIVRRVRPRLYINFFQYLPPEVCLKILGFLDPLSLINTARASREWMLLALDRKLWEHLYYLEGFRVIQYEVRAFEESLNRSRSIDQEDQHVRKKRATPQGILPSLQPDEDSEMPDAEPPIQRLESLFGLTTGQSQSRSRGTNSVDATMTDAQSSSGRHTPKKYAQERSRHGNSMLNSLPKKSSQQSKISPLTVVDRSDNKQRLNWQYLYSQRRRLEANWEAEKFTNFQLPHPNHPEEAHEECIYTIQHSGKYLVSGSRDRTLRIWDLDTQRLIQPPLRAHTGSVLCLQFDADPEEDLIVSGSSDATVTLWRFSTGQIIQRLRRAHRESVLNVRFDKNVLVTCSKDKTIKVFNRRPLYPGETGYPISQGVNPIPTYLNNYGFNPAPTAGLPVKPEYSVIACLEGHGAAVNAVQIHGNEVVSASGDRTVKVWNWPDQTCTRTLVGHTKGIACVQYDGRRIVSGSSDNEVKVFDKETGLEVASLRAHTNLVRTVQAGFGDLPYSVQVDREDAKRIDSEFFKAVESGALSKAEITQRGRSRNAGSSRPQDITAYGANLPPGGGGGKFGRIVSGSYDETIIIWRRDKEGVWKAQHALRQEEASQAAGRRGRTLLTSTPVAIAPLPIPSAPSAPSASTIPASPGPSSTVANASAPEANTSNSHAPGTQGFYHHMIDTVVPQGPVALRQMIEDHPAVLHLLNISYLRSAINALPDNNRQIMNFIVSAARQGVGLTVGSTDNNEPTIVLSTSTQPINNAQALIQSQRASSASTQAPDLATVSNTQAPTQIQPPRPTTSIQVQTSAPIQSQAQPSVQIQAPAPTQTQAQPPTATAQSPPQLTQAANPTPHVPIHHPNLHPANQNRVFKLQFDARRIICCSQTSTIVGWDFANGDEQLIEASRFFAPIE